MVLASIVTFDWRHRLVPHAEWIWWRASASRWVGVYADPNHMAMNMGLVVPLAVAFLARKESGWVLRAACGVAAVLAVVAIVLSHSRGGFIGLSVAMAVWAFREKRRLQAIVVGGDAGGGPGDVRATRASGSATRR